MSVVTNSFQMWLRYDTIQRIGFTFRVDSACVCIGNAIIAPYTETEIEGQVLVSTS